MTELRIARNQRGFTLTELMVVVGVAGIMAVIAIPSFIKLMPRIRLNNDAMIMANDINLARMSSIAKNQFVEVRFTPASESYTVINTDANITIEQKTLVDTVIDTVSGFDTANTIEMNPMGSLNVTVGGTGMVDLETDDGTHKRRIEVEPNGQVSVLKWNGSQFVED